MLIQVASLTSCVVSTADAKSIRAANALAALRMYWDRSCTVSLAPDGKWRAACGDGGVVTADSPAGLHSKLTRLAGTVPPLGRRLGWARSLRRNPAWIPGPTGLAGTWP